MESHCWLAVLDNELLVLFNISMLISGDWSQYANISTLPIKYSSNALSIKLDTLLAILSDIFVKWSDYYAQL